MTPLRRPAARLGLLALCAAALAGCGQSVEAPYIKGACYTMTKSGGPKGKIEFHLLTTNVPDLEHCGAALEAVRLRFLSLGGTRTVLDGAYQGQFIFVEPEGISTSTALDKSPFLILVRTGDGHLVQPGANH